MDETKNYFENYGDAVAYLMKQGVLVMHHIDFAGSLNYSYRLCMCENANAVQFRILLLTDATRPNFMKTFIYNETLLKT